MILFLLRKSKEILKINFCGDYHFVILHRVLNRFVKLLSDTEKKGEDKVNHELKEMREALEEKSKGAAKYDTF